MLGIMKTLLIMFGALGVCSAQVRPRHIQCYVCDPQFSHDCVEAQNIHSCVYGVHDACRVTVTVYDTDRKLYERACATYQTCIARQQEAWDNWLCDEEKIGSQCTYCCNNTACNSMDPTVFLFSGVEARQAGYAEILVAVVVCVLAGSGR